MERRQTGLPLFVYPHSLKPFLSGSPREDRGGGFLRGAFVEQLMKSVIPLLELHSEPFSQETMPFLSFPPLSILFSLLGMSFTFLAA